MLEQNKCFIIPKKKKKDVAQGPCLDMATQSWTFYSPELSQINFYSV